MVRTENIYLGRQPILDRKYNLNAFELLFRSGIENRAIIVNDMVATSAVIASTLSEFGIEAVLGKYYGFINCDAVLLQSDFIELLPAEKIVLEILETTVANEALLERCKELKKRGFRLALDDFQGEKNHNYPFLDIVDIVKVDIRGLSKDDLILITQDIKARGIIMLAEKVETKEDFELCFDLGYDLFQGYYFAKAENVSGKRLSVTQQAIIQLLVMVQREAETADLVEAFKRNPSLSISLLRLTNSAAVGLKQRVQSLLSAISLLGRRQLQRWLMLLLMSHGSVAGNKQSALIYHAAARAKFMELMALSNPSWTAFSEGAFITGLVSVMEVALGVPLKTLTESIKLAPEVQDALLERKGVLGNLLNLVEAMEKDDIVAVSQFVGKHVFCDFDRLTQAHGQTAAWVNQIIDTGL